MVLVLFCRIDDFCLYVEASYGRRSFHVLPANGSSESPTKRTRLRARCITDSEIITINILFHVYGYRCFKHFYLDVILGQMKDLFPQAPTYHRFLELSRETSVLQTLFLISCFGKNSGISFVDSTKLEVCHLKRSKRNKVFADSAEFGKTSTGWFFGFKLHLICNDQGELLWVKLTSGNVDDRTALMQMFDCDLFHLAGLLFGDKGYIGQEKYKELIEKHAVKLITPMRKNMQRKIPLAEEERILLRKRVIIETVIDQLKNISQIQHTRHRSFWGFLTNLIGGLIAYCLKPTKPSLRSIWPTLPAAA